MQHRDALLRIYDQPNFMMLLLTTVVESSRRTKVDTQSESNPSRTGVQQSRPVRRPGFWWSEQSSLREAMHHRSDLRRIDKSSRGLALQGQVARV